MKIPRLSPMKAKLLDILSRSGYGVSIIVTQDCIRFTIEVGGATGVIYEDWVREDGSWHLDKYGKTGHGGLPNAPGGPVVWYERKERP